MGYFGSNELTAKNSGELKIKRIDGHWQYDKNGYIYDDSSYVDAWCSGYTGEYTNVLVAGLGIGVIPQWFATEKGANVDVVEIDADLIEEIKKQDYLDSKITIINEDIFDHEPTKHYDLIVLDIWWDRYYQEYKDEFNNLKVAFADDADVIDAPYLDL